MSDVINMHKAKSTLSQLVVRALEGEEVIIGRAGKPMVKLVPVSEQSSPISIKEKAPDTVYAPDPLQNKKWYADDDGDLEMQKLIGIE